MIGHTGRKRSLSWMCALLVVLSLLEAGCAGPDGEQLFTGTDVPTPQRPFPGKIAAVVYPRSYPGTGWIAGETAVILVDGQNPAEQKLLHRPGKGGWSCPRWSPDGTKLALVGPSLMNPLVEPYGYEGELSIMANEGGSTSISQTNSCAVWSPDGQGLLYVYHGSLYTVTADVLPGTGIQVTAYEVLPPSREGWIPSGWSPINDRILFEKEGSIFEARLDGTGAVTLTTGCQNGSGRYSPDGREIVFVRDCSTGGYGQICRMDLDGTKLTCLGRGSSPQWSPDGAMIGFIWQGSIYAMDRDGAEKDCLLCGTQWYYESFSWAP